MKRLIVTADIHGSFSTWLTVKELIRKDDFLAVAGDLFDTKFGNRMDSDFQPEFIREDAASICDRLFYVYGNCDTESFFPKYTRHLEFSMFGRHILLTHGHRFLPETSFDPGIIIQGHTHVPKLEKINGVVHMNPGSLKKPKNRIYTYGIIENGSAAIIDLKNNTALSRITI
ncbi:MAG: YfcE family phosphodiesterase [Desulfobacteraceae bacterium]